VGQIIGPRLTFGSQYVARIHGDFDLANILVDPQGGLYIVDFADTREGLALSDLVRLWHAVWAISELSQRRRRALQPFLEALIDGYGNLEVKTDSPLFLALRCWNALTLILSASMFGTMLGFSGNRALRQLAAVNRTWLESTDFSLKEC